MVTNIAVDTKFGLLRAIHIEIREERWVLEAGKGDPIRPQGRMEVTVDPEFQSVTVGEDGSFLSRALRGMRVEVPVKIWLNHRLDYGINLRTIKGGTQLGNAKHIRNTRALDGIIAVAKAGILEGTPCDNAAIPWIRGAAIMNLGVINSLLLLSSKIAGSAIDAAESAPFGVVELSDCFSEEKGHSRNRIL